MAATVDVREGAALVAAVVALVGALDAGFVLVGVARLTPSETDGRGRWEVTPDFNDTAEPDGDTTE